MPDQSRQGSQAMDSTRLAELRRRAASRLTGAAAGKGSMDRAVDALSVLHALASSEETAADALTLLHELQVHQVELDLQAEELRESRVELESALRRQVELYDLQPFGCFTLDARLVIHELNLAGADLLGIPRDEACGTGIEVFLGAESASRLESAISRVRRGQHRASCRLSLRPTDGAGRGLVASISRDSEGSRYLVGLAEIAADEDRPAEAH